MQKIRKLLVTLLVMLMIGITPITAFADVIKTAVFSDDIGITINGTKYDARVVIIEGTSYLPIKVLGYAINAETEWDAENRAVVISRKEEAVEVEKVIQTLDGKMDKKKAYFSDDIKLIVDGERMNKQVVIVERISYLPIQAVGENMGIRVTWDNTTRVIKIVNPKTTIVDDSIKEYYVADLPKVITQEDYLVGNWRGYSYWNSNAQYEVEVFITKNNDGSYTVINKLEILNGEYKGKEFIVKLKGSYNEKTKIFYSKFQEYIKFPTGVGEFIYFDDTYILKGDVLYQIEGADEGQLERF